MSKQRKTPRGLCGKLVFKSQGAAFSAALKSSKRGGYPIRVYYCTKCHGLHLTSKVITVKEQYERQV